jgi:diguanylate cyclase (GGDEF)-like protein
MQKKAEIETVTGNYLSIGITVSIIVIFLFILARRYYQLGKERDSYDDQFRTSLKEILSRDTQIKKLNIQNNQIQNLNSRYLSFILKFPTIIQRLNSTAKLKESALSVVELVNDLIVTDTVELYLLDSSRNLLKRLFVDHDDQEEPVTYALGEGIIGTAGENRFIIMKEHYNKFYAKNKEGNDSSADLSMAVPIIFNERLLGVIGIGKIEQPAGNESDLLRMIADISGVALVNQILLNEAQHKANTDALTGLRNRNYFYQMAQHHIEKAARERKSISIILFDLDNFKHYNDTHGHNKGDDLLVELSRLISETSRKESTIARYGGEEFIIMLPGISRDKAFIYADRLREMISAHHFPHMETQPLGIISISGGVASFPEDGDTIYEVIQKADKSLYQAKSEGRNRVLLYRGAVSQR